jgi:ABC-type antimicrobial peptide transport system permease subunit
MSLGATGADVGRLVMTEALRPVVAGLLLGVLSAAALGRLLRAFLYGVSASDPLSYVVAAAILLAAACAAAVIPARRAVRVDPMAALTAE